ncbi:MAG: anthrone oxygenase family protein [Pseudomonadota bacterium]
MSFLAFTLTQIAGLAYALVGGVFLAFSDFIMRSLARTSGAGGVEAMQVINREVFRWIFMTLFIGLAPASLLLAGYGLLFVGDGPGITFALAGLIYFVGCFVVTVLFNVPMNEALARLETGSDAARTYWVETYLPRWTRWNTVRAVACAIASALLTFGLLWQAQVQAHVI